jgi:pentose-5-phosphate-3-epimerase
VNADTLQDTVRAGADWLVMGSAFFREKDYGQALEKFMELSKLA